MSSRNLLIICCTLLIIGVLFWPTLYRYDHTTVNGNVLPIRINRLSGNTEWFVVGKWKPVSSSSKRARGDKIPTADLSKIIVKADFHFSSFGGSIYNGTDWIITSVTFKYTPIKIDLSDIANKYQNQTVEKPQNAKQQQIDLSDLAEKKEEERRYFVDTIIMPLTVSSFSINPIEQGNVLSKWVIDEATGYKE